MKKRLYEIFIAAALIVIVANVFFLANHQPAAKAQPPVVAIQPQPETEEVETDGTCPLEGSATTTRLQLLNELKNRTAIPTEANIDHNVTIEKLLAPGDDRHRWDSTKAATIYGYVVGVKPGGIESCNCKAKEIPDRDTHIEIVLDPMKYGNNLKVIVEVTPRMRAIMQKKGIDWSTTALRRDFLGRYVEAQGWLMNDFEHQDAAENTNPGNVHNWRATSWELHPLDHLKVLDKR